MADTAYYGAYTRFDTASKKEAARLLGADNLVGDRFEIEFVKEDAGRVAWIKNKFGELVGYFDEDTTRSLSVFEARGWKLDAVLAFVAFTESPAPGHYWGEVALFCYDAKLEVFDRFVDGIATRIGDGNRPEIVLGGQGVDRVVESGGEWTPSKLLPKPKMDPGTALLKTRRSMSEKLIEQGRRGNKGCYFISWLFLLGLVAALIFGLRACGVF